MDAAKIAIRHQGRATCKLAHVGALERTHVNQALLRIPVARIMLEEVLCAELRVCVLKRVRTGSIVAAWKPILQF